MEVAMTKAHGEVEVARYEGRCGGETEVVTMTLLCEKELRNTTLEASTALSDAQVKIFFLTILSSCPPLLFTHKPLKQCSCCRKIVCG